MADEHVASLLSDLSRKILLDRQARRAIMAEIQEYASRDMQERSFLALIAVDLDHYYTSIEASFEAIARTMDYSSATPGLDWHRALLNLMAAPGPSRPPVINDSTRSALDGLRRFRHFLRHAYAVTLDWQKLKPLVDDLPFLDRRLDEDLVAFEAFIEQCLQVTG